MSDKEKLAKWIMAKGYATGHGDSVEDLLQELDWQLAENWKWVGLTDDEIAQLMYKCDVIVTGPTQFDFARAIEAKLKEKNG